MIVVATDGSRDGGGNGLQEVSLLITKVLYMRNDLLLVLAMILFLA